MGVLDPLTAAAEPNLRRILQLLGSEPRTVTDIAAEFTVTRSAISQHLLVLAEAGLVEATKVGRQRIYRVLPSGLQRLQAEIDRFWTNELDAMRMLHNARYPALVERAVSAWFAATGNRLKSR